MTHTTDSQQFGVTSISPATDIIAGSFSSLQLTYQAGQKGISLGGQIRIHTDSDSDWGTPQFTDPTAEEYATVIAPEGVRVIAQTIGVKTVLLTIRGRVLTAGEEITFCMGDRSAGSPGSRAQTFFDPKRNFWFDIDTEGTGERVTLADSPSVSIIGGDAIRLVVTAPSEVTVGEEFNVIFKAEDIWGNPSHSYQGNIELSGDGIEFTNQTVTFSENHQGVQRIAGFTATTAGPLKITASDITAGFLSCSNPILATEQTRQHRLNWADPHGGQLVLNSKISGFYQYARDVSGIQFVGYQRNADVLSKEDWKVQQREEREFYQPGFFVPIPGFEWSGRTWDGGHHNVYFRQHDQPVRRNSPAETSGHVDQGTELPHIKDVYNEYRNSDVTLTVHVGGEHSNLKWHEPSLEPAAEIVSTHGMFEWLLRETIERKYKIGFIGGSDSYTGRPGDDRPGFQHRRVSKAGLTGIYTEDITIEGFHEALRNRRVYATTGARIIMHAEGDGHFMGTEYTTSEPPNLSVSAIGTAPIESVELFRGTEMIKPFPIEAKPVPHQVRLLWAGASRMMSYSGIIWDGNLKVQGGQIKSVDTIRFDSPRSHLTEQTEDTLTWQAYGCGYPMGLVLELDNDDAILEIAVDTQTMSFPMFGGHGETGPRRVSYAPADRVILKVPVKELATGPERWDLGVLDQRIEVSQVCEKMSDRVEFSFTDPAPQPGVNSYWFRVIQTDQEHAWTSPVFVDYAPSTRS